MLLMWTGNEFQAAGPATVNELSASYLMLAMDDQRQICEKKLAGTVYWLEMCGNNFRHAIVSHSRDFILIPILDHWKSETSTSFPFIPEKQFLFPPISIPIWTKTIVNSHQLITLHNAANTDYRVQTYSINCWHTILSHDVGFLHNTMENPSHSQSFIMTMNMSWKSWNGNGNWNKTTGMFYSNSNSHSRDIFTIILIPMEIPCNPSHSHSRAHLQNWPLSGEVFNLVHGHSKQEEVIGAHLLTHLNVGAI